MKAPLVFTGQDGSMGLHRGRVYHVEIRQRRGGSPHMSSPRRCPYGSWSAFWRNWQPVPGAPRVRGPWVTGTFDGDPMRCPARQADTHLRCGLPWPHPGWQHDRPFGAG